MIRVAKYAVLFTLFCMTGIAILQGLARYAFLLAGAEITEPAMLAFFSAWASITITLIVMTYPGFMSDKP